MTARSHKTLGDVLREARVELDLGLRELARHLKKSPSYISDIENNRRVPSEDVLAELAKILRLDFEELMALAGRLGSDTSRMISRNPQAVALFRRISTLRPDQLREVAKTVEEISESKARKK